MPAQAKVLAHSSNPCGNELVTFEVCFPRIILAQVRTYSMLAYSVRSSRAVPTSKLIEEVEREPFVPAVWRHRQKGMVAGGVLSEPNGLHCRSVWLNARDAAVELARGLDKLGAAKEHVNRLLEPFAWSWAVVTGTRFEVQHLLDQRTADDAQPEFQELARLMRDALAASMATPLRAGEWHMPYLSDGERTEVRHAANYLSGPASLARDLSAARCARVSYSPFDVDEVNATADEKLAERLWADGHLSPFEHVAMSCATPAYRGKYAGFLSYRGREGF